MDQACERSAFPLLAQLDDAGRSLGVDVRSADIDVEAGKSGFGLGLKAALRWYLRRRRPLVIVGILKQEELVRVPGNGALHSFLDSPRVRYMQLPLDSAALEAAARAVVGSPLSVEEVEQLGDAVVQIHLADDLYRDVIHRIDSGSGALFKQWVDSLRETADNASGRDAAGPAAREPADFHDSLMHAIVSLEKLISQLSQYGFKRAAPVLSKLRTQAKNLRRAEELARRLVDFEMGEQSPGAGPRLMEEAAKLGLAVLKIKSDSLKVLKPLCHGRRG